MNRQQRIGTLIFLMLCVACLGVVLLRNRYPSPPADPQAEALLNSRLESLRLPAERKGPTADTTRRHPHPRKGAGKHPRRKQPAHPVKPAPATPRSPLDEPVN